MKNKNFIVTIALGMIFFVAIAYSLVRFNNTVNDELEKSVRTTLADMATQQQLALNRQVENMLLSLVGMSETLLIIGDEEEVALEFINSKKESLQLQAVLIADEAGKALLDTGEQVDVASTDYFEAAMRGESFATQMHVSPYTGEDVFTVSVPIVRQGEIVGVLAVEYCAEYMSSLLTNFTDERGLNLVVDSDSQIVLSTNEFVLSFDAFRSAEFEEGASFESVVSDFQNGNAGSISYSIGGVQKYGEYRPLEINDWMLFFEISEESVLDSAQNISRSMILTSILLIAFAFSAILYVVLSKNRSAKELEKVAYYDEMTGIPNLLKFKMLVAQALEKEPDKQYAMVKMDMVNFKAVNEMFGYEQGNQVICAIAQTGKSVEDKSFVQARVSAEEFMFFAESDLFENLDKSSKEYEAHFKTLLPQLAEHQFTFRYGRYFVRAGECDVNDMVNKTNIAHSFAKKDGGSFIWNYDESFTKKVLRDTEIANKMHKALEQEEFQVYLQPKYSVANRGIIGAEALVRWVEANGSMVYPNEFIPLFEQNGFIVELDRYMLKNVCKTLKSWKEKGQNCIPVSVNFSRLHIQNKNFVKELENIVFSYGVNPKYIEIELTESTVMENEKELRVLLKKIHKAGFLVSIDDFGSGYSSLGMLKNFEVDTLKLDRSFFVEVEDEEEHSRGDMVVESIVKLAGKLGMYTVAEGIEEKQQEDFLRKINCEAAQGYLFSKPLPIGEFEKLYFDQL